MKNYIIIVLVLVGLVSMCCCTLNAQDNDFNDLVAYQIWLQAQQNAQGNYNARQIADYQEKVARCQVCVQREIAGGMTPQYAYMICSGNCQ